jgi:Autophagy protein 16 (ATG16)
MRRDLAEALRASGQLKLRVTTAEKELVTLRAKTRLDTKIIEDLTRERALLAQKVKDRDEELKSKSKFIVV